MAKDVAIVLCDGSVNSVVTAALAAQRCRVVMVYGEERGSEGEVVSGGGRRRGAVEGLVELMKPYREHTVVMPVLPGVKKVVTVAQRIDPRAAAVLDERLQGKLLELLPLMGIAGRLAGYYEASSIHLGLQVGLEGGTIGPVGGDELSRGMEYLQVFTELLQLPCGLRGVEVVAPLLEMEAWQVVDLGVQVGAPLEKTWSCEADGAEPCGTCEGCRERDAAFERAAKVDPLKPGRK